ncbi:MAG: hypothetical protein ACOYM9_13090, partial [Bradymonadia bacterium]
FRRAVLARAGCFFSSLLDALGVRYLVGGSVASSLLGLPRATLDADMVADLEPSHVGPLVEALGEAFYADEDAIREAVRLRKSFNVIHLPTAFKVDVFVMRHDAYSQTEMDRRIVLVLGEGPDRTLAVATAEDMVLQKLDWFRRGGGVSDRQWNDVVGLIKTRGTSLDRAYLDPWASALDLDALLAIAWANGRPPRLA